jgi:hypothetical protein
MNLFTYNIKMFKMKRLLFTLLMMCGIAYAQPGVDSTQTLPNPTPMTAKEYKFKYIQALNTISARSKFFGYDSAFFKNGIYTDITPPADDSSDLVPNTDWVMRQLAAYTPGGGGAEDTLILGRGIARDSLAPTKNRIYLDSSIYRVVQLNDSTLEFAHYDGRLDTVVVSGSGGGSKWSTVGNAGTTAGTNFIGTTDAQGLMFMTDNIQSGYIDINLASTSFGQYSLDDSTTGQSNSAFGYNALASNSSGNQNTAVGNDGLFLNTTGGNNTAIGNQSLLALVSGNANTAIGAFTSGATSSTDTSIAIGFQASASTKQLAFSPHVTQIKATGITGASNSGYVLTTNGSGIATFQAPSGSGGSPAGNYGNIQINRNGAFDTPGGDSLIWNGGLSSVGNFNNILGTGESVFGDGAGDVFMIVSGVAQDGNIKYRAVNGHYFETGDVTVSQSIIAHNIIGATATQTDANFSATAGTAYVLSGNNSATRTITMPTLAEGDVFEFYNENTSANKWVSSATIYLSDNTTFTTLADDTNYILRYVGGKLRVSN